MKIYEIASTTDQLQIAHMNEQVVKPYLEYVKGLNSFLKEDAGIDQKQIDQMVNTAEQGKQVVLPDEVKDKFEQSMPAADAGPVKDFANKANSAVAKIKDPTIKQKMMDKIKWGIKHPSAQQALLAGVSSAAGMLAGAVSGGLGTGAGKAVANAVGGGLLSVINAKMAGQSWKDSLKAGLHGGAIDALDGAYSDDEEVRIGRGAETVGKVSQQGDAGGQTAAAGNGKAATPQDLTQQWQQFVNYGQQLIQQMTAQQKTA